MIDNNEIPSAVDPIADYSKMLSPKMPSNMLANATDTGLSIEPRQEELSISDQAVNEFDNQRQDALNTSFMSVAGTNPDKAAENLRIANQIGVGQDIVSRNEQESKKRNDIMRLQAYDLINKNAVLADLMTDPNFASVAHDDIPQLSSLGGLFKVLGAAATGQPFPPEVAIEIAQQFGGSQYQTEEALIYHWMSNNGLEEKDLNEETRQRLKTLEENAPPPINTYLFGGASYLAGQMYSMALEVSKYALTGAATGAALTAAGGPIAIGGTIGGAGLGATVGVGVVTSQIEGGMIYKDLLRSGVPKDVARTLSSIGGTANGLVEIGTLGLATAPFKPLLKKVIGEQIIKRGIKLAKPTAIGAVKTAAKYYAMAEGGEQIQELSQETVSIIVEEIARSYAPGEYESKLATPEGRQELANRYLDVAEQTFKATAIMGSFGPMLNLAVDAKNIRDSAKTKQFLTDLSKNVQATKLKGRSPSALANFVAAQAQGTAAETMYVDAEEMVNVLNQSGLTAQQIDNALPGVREQLAQATSGGDIQIPTAQFAANIVGTKLEAPLMEHARLAPDAISAKQAISQQETMQQNMKDAQAEMAVQEKVNAQFVREAKEIEKVVNDQLVAAGRPPTEALFAAKLVQARAVTGAAAAGITPAQWVAQHPVPTFQSQRQAAQQAPAQGSFEQASRADLGLGKQVAFDEASQRPEVVTWAKEKFGDRTAPDGSSVWQNFTEWFGDSKVVDAEGKPMVVYHGTNVSQPFNTFVVGPVGNSGIGIYFTTLAESASEFSGTKDGSQIIPAFVSLKNPFIGNEETYITDIANALSLTRDTWIKKASIAAQKQGINHDKFITKQLKNAGYDGIIVNRNSGEKYIIAFEPTQIKSATANVGTFGQQDPNILRQEAISEQQPGANSPGVGVEEKPKLGFWKPFRVKVTSDVEIPKKPLILTGTKNSNAQKQLVNIDGILEKFPNAGESVDEWTNMMAYALGSDEVPIPPYAFIKGINGNGSFETLSKLTAGQIADASYGFENAKEIREAYTSGQLDVTFTAKLILWSFLSRGVSPYTQESLFIDAFNGSAEWIDKASKGEFTEADFPAYEEWAKSVAPKGSGQPGAGATHNLNAFGQDFLFKMSRIGENGKSHLQNLHEMFSDPNQTGKKIRREFSKFGEGVGIDNKVISFTLLVAGFSDVMILDRVQIRQLWDDGRFQGVNLYDGSKNEEGNKISGSSMNDITEGVRGILVYEALERQLEKRIGALYEKLGRPQDASTGRYHWETWVAFSEQEASHGTLMAILKDAKGDDQAISNVASKQGEYGTYEYGTLYNRDKNGTPWFKYETPSGNSYSFSVLAFREFLANIKQPKNGVVPTKFKVTESGNAPWYTRPEVNKQQLDTQAAKWADLAGGTGEGKRITDETIQRDIANRARSSADAESIAKSWEIPTKPAGLGTIQSKLFAGGEATKFARSNRESNGTHFSYERSPVGNVEGSRLLGVPTVGAFTAGSGLAELYKKSGNATPTFYELKSSVAGAERFHSAISDNKSASKFGAAVAVYSVEDYKGMRLFLSEDGNSGVAIKPDGDIVSVFSSGGAGRSLMELAVSAGGKKLDAFDTVLPHFYAPHGFVVASRMDWNEEFKPEGWNKETFSEFNGGSPDVVFMSRDDSFTGKYNPTDGTKFEDYDKAVEKQQESINVINKPLFQAAEGGARGEYDPIKNLIGIGKNADYSTVAHELAHWYVVDLFRTASDSTASEASRADADILLKWFGIAGDNVDQRLANWNAMTLDEQRRHHEAVAYNWELYLHTGKAPSVELQGVFDRFRRWLTRAYKSIRDDLNEIYKIQFGTDLPFLTDEVRGVFDRMLASEEQISRREAIDNFKGMYQTQEESGMSDAVWAAMQAQNAESHEMGVTQLLKETVKEMKWESGAKEGFLKKMQDAEDGFRKVIRSEESDKMGNEPVRKAERFFKTGKMVDPSGKEIEVLVGNKIDSVAVGGMYPTSTTGLAPAVDLTKLRGMTMEGGLAPDLAAEMFGFSSGDELIRALAELKPFKDELKERTDARMLDEHGGMNTEAEKEEAVNKALANEVRARIVAIENRYLTKVKTPVAVIMQGAKELARTILGRMAIKDIKPRNYVAAEARVAKDKHTAVKAMQSPETAGKSAYTRSFNEQIAAGVEESVAASEALIKSVEAIKRAQAKIDAHKKQYGDVDPAIVAAKASHQQVIQGQLAKEGYKILEEVDKALAYVKRIVSDVNRKNMGADHADQIESILERFGLMGKYVAPTTRTPLATWAQVQQDIGFDIEIPDIVQESVRKNFLELTPEEFQDVIDTVKQIAHTGKAQQLVLTMDRKITFEKAKTEIVDSINANAGGRKAKTRTATTNIGRTIETLTGFFAAHLKAAIVAQIMDGGKDGGPLWNYLIRSANTAGNKETTMRAAATKRISEILDPVFKGGKMGGAGVYFPSVDRSFNRESVLTIALNMGNESNMQRLLDGEGWTIEQVMPIIQSLTAAELNAIQEVWDYSETFKAEIIEKSRRTVGREPNWIEPKPFQVMSADGQMVSLKGGYYPVKYDPRASARSQSLSAAEQALRDLKDAYIAATTRRSYTKSRVKEVYDRPLLLNLSGLYSGIGEVIHDLSWHEWLIDSNRLMRSSAFDKAVREQYGVEFKDQITSWIKDVAAGDKGANNAGEMALNYLRQGVSAAGLGFNLMSAVGQITGFAQSVVKVGAKWIGRGIAVSASDPKAAIERVYALSSFMANRGSTQFRELNEIKNMVRGENVAMKRVRVGTYFLMMQMQRMVDVPTWIGAYEKQLSINSDEKLAIAIADQAVIDSQGGGMLKDLSAIERGGPIQKLFTVFYSFMNTNLNLAVLKGMTEKNAGKWVAQQTMLWVVPVVTMYMLKKLLTPQAGDDDDKFDLKEMAKELAAEELSFLMGSFMVVREFADAAKIVTGAKTYGTDYRGPAGLRMIGDTYKFATQAAQLEFDTAFRKAAINIIGSSSGLPAAQINRTIDGIEALLEGETENITAPLFGVKKR